MPSNAFTHLAATGLPGICRTHFIDFACQVVIAKTVPCVQLAEMAARMMAAKTIAAEATIAILIFE